MDNMASTLNPGSSPNQSLDASTLEVASSVPIYNEDGLPIEFGTIFKEQKVIVVFISTSATLDG